MPTKRAQVVETPDPLFPLRSKDPIGEWINPHECPLILSALERLPDDYDLSVAYIRGNRPLEPGSALRFWSSPLSRAHFLNALLLRGERTLVMVHQGLNINNEKAYSYLPRWGVQYRQRRRAVMVQDGLGDTYAARVIDWHSRQGTAHLCVKGYNLTVTAHWAGHLHDVTWSVPEEEQDSRDAISSLYRTAEVIDAGSLVSFEVASFLTGLTLAAVAQVIPSVGRAIGGVNLTRLSTFEAMVPRHKWRMTLAEAQVTANRCKCVFWNAHRLACGLENPLPRPGERCSDREALPPPTDLTLSVRQ